MKEYRDYLLQEQDHICPITRQYIQPTKAVIDHEHYASDEHGQAVIEDYLPIRGVLSKRGNKWEGVVSKLLCTYRVPLDFWADFLRTPPPDFVHCLYFEYKALFDPDSDLSFQEMINNLIAYWNRETNYLRYPRRITKCQTQTQMPTLH